ncbi:START domain-containing protein, partial [Trichostrongylus colubriformis]
QYGKGLRSTAHALVEALKIFDDAKRADRKDWKQKAENKGDKCFNKRFPIGKVYYLKKVLNIDYETLFKSHWNEVERTPEWNENVHSLKRIDTISEYADVLHYTTSDVIVVKGRDFVVCRMWRKVSYSGVMNL